jgi:predicted RNA binding protein YcfA (HicA-like mRNA interferase family)
VKLTDLLKEIELHKVYTDKDRPAFKSTEEKLTEASNDTFINILTKFGFTKGARDWGGHHFFVHKSKGLYATYHPVGRSLVIEPKRGGKPVFDSARSNFSIKALLNYLQSPSNKFVSTEEKLSEKWDASQAFSSKEAKKIMDDSLRGYAKELRKVQYKIIKDWMSKAKSGVIDFFDIHRGLTHGDIRRAHPYETDFLHKVLTKDKIIDRFRQYFGGKKGKANRTK